MNTRQPATPTQPSARPEQPSESSHPRHGRRQARQTSPRKGFYIHLLVYLAVNGGLWLMAWPQGRTPSLYPAAAWGIGLAFHAIHAFLRSPKGRQAASGDTDAHP